MLWSRLTEPSQFPLLYPNWTTKVGRDDDESYRVSYRGSAPAGTHVSASCHGWIETTV